MCSQSRVLFILSLAFPLLLIHLPVSAQSSDSNIPTFKANSRLVLVDVVVRDRRGGPVTGLQASDFRLFEDRVAQKFGFFEEHRGAKASNIKVPALPPNMFTNFPTVKAPDGVDVVLLDCLNTEPKNQVSLRENLIKYLKNASPGSSVAIFTLGSRLRLVRGFTTDLSGLAVAIGDRKSGSRTEFSRLFPTAFQKDTDKSIVGLMAMNQAAPEAIDALKQFQADETSRLTESRAALTSQALRQLVWYVNRIPGRKNLIWFADSFPINIVPDTREHASKSHPAGEDLANMLRESQVAVYPISTQGLMVETQYDTGIFNPDSIQQQSVERATTQLAIQNLAHETGGEAFFNSNDFSECLNKALRNGSQYYTVGYTPSDAKGNGKYRRINIEVKNCNCTLSYRRGYYADDPAAPKKADENGPHDPLVGLMGFGMPTFDQIVYKISVAAINADPDPKEVSQSPDRSTLRYAVDFAISTTDVRFQTTLDGIRHGELGIMMVVYSREGKPLAIVSRKSKLAILPSDFKEFERVGLQVHGEIEIPVGESYLRTGVYDYQAGSIGTLAIPVSISLHK